MNLLVAFDCEFESVVFIIVHFDFLIELSSYFIVEFSSLCFYGLVALVLRILVCY